MIKIIRDLKGLLSLNERRRAYVLAVMVLIMAMLDVIGIASIMPFMAVLASPEVIYSNRWLNAAYAILDFQDPNSFLFFLGLVVFITLVVSVIFKAVTSWAIEHFTAMRNYSVARRLVAGYLAQPYDWFLDRHSADLGKSVLSEVQIVVEKALLPMMRMLAQGTIVTAILLLLIVVDPFLAFIVGVVMGGAYGLIYMTFRGLVLRTGRDRVSANAARFKIISEAFGGIKETKVGGIEDIWLRRFDSAAKKYARTQFIATIVAILPRYALEVIVFGGMLVLTLFLMYRGEGLQAVLPMLALYALAGYRLMPAMQLVYRELTTLKFAVPALNQLHKELRTLHTATEAKLSRKSDSKRPELWTQGPSRTISLDNVTYAYPNTASPAIKDLTINVVPCTTVGFVGKTGSGKTTAVDIILGLLQPEKGCMRVDNVVITSENRSDWLRLVGYVPQHIFLADDSISANVAFGVPKDKIDRTAVERASRIANLHQFIVDESPNGYETLVGERGLRLSGGQRQRIGIARALYHEPKVIVMDEATSALDNLTEHAVMEAVHNLGSSMTVILIAHRLTTVRDCDYIYMLDHGQLIGEGTYEELDATHSRFRELAGEGNQGTTEGQ